MCELNEQARYFSFRDRVAQVSSQWHDTFCGCRSYIARLCSPSRPESLPEWQPFVYSTPVLAVPAWPAGGVQGFPEGEVFLTPRTRSRRNGSSSRLSASTRCSSVANVG